jgi:alpha-L-arabinofuranosidase
MYRAHQGAQSLRALVSAPAISYARDKGTGTLPGLSCSASLHGKALTLTVTNPSLDQARDVEIGLRGASAVSAKAVTLAAADAHAHNSFDSPHSVEPREEQAQAGGKRFNRRFPPASVTKLEIALA